MAWAHILNFFFFFVLFPVLLASEGISWESANRWDKQLVLVLRPVPKQFGRIFPEKKNPKTNQLLAAGNLGQERNSPVQQECPSPPKNGDI